MLGFVIMGIILNAEFVVPYLTFAFVVSNNIYLCFSHTQTKYKEIKDIIATKWQELKPADAEGNTIPEKLFWFVVIPNEKEDDKEDDKEDEKKVVVLSKFSTEIFRLFFKILAIVVFLSVALTAILLFKITYGASAIIPTISVFISGKFSELFFTGITTQSSFLGLEKIYLEEEIKRLVHTYNGTSGTATRKMTMENETATTEM
jgi:sensor histidine kinase YesM